MRAGETVDAVLAEAPRWLPEVDRYVLSSAAQSGQLVETLLVLSHQHAFAGRQAAATLGATVYPLFLVHFAVLSLPVHVLIMESGAAYLRTVGPFLVPLWAVIALLAWATIRRHWWLRALMRLVPLLRGYTKNRSVADLSFTLRAYLVAGETVDVAWFGAARACNDRRLRRLGEKVSAQARRGVPPGELIGKTRALPEDFVSLYQTGEQTGQLDENLAHLWELFSERAAGKMRSASFWYPKLLLVAVAIGIAYVVVQTYLAHFNSVLEML